VVVALVIAAWHYLRSRRTEDGRGERSASAEPLA
jgi:hypothetical protein